MGATAWTDIYLSYGNSVLVNHMRIAFPRFVPVLCYQQSPVHDAATHPWHRGLPSTHWQDDKDSTRL